MMSGIFFILRSLVLTFVVIIVLQIRIGPKTLEERVMSWAQNSHILQPLQTVAESGVHLIQEVWIRVTQKAGQKSQERIQLKFERSSQYLKSKTQELREQATPALERFSEDQAE